MVGGITEAKTTLEKVSPPFPVMLPDGGGMARDRPRSDHQKLSTHTTGPDFSQGKAATGGKGGKLKLWWEAGKCRLAGG